VESDFATARIHLRAARRCLHGSDQISDKATEALDLLIVALITAEFTRDQGKVISFRKRVDRRSLRLI
jgi:hypothetical protein